MNKHISLLDIKILRLPMSKVVNEFFKFVDLKDYQGFATTPNAEILLKSFNDDNLKKCLCTSSLNMPDSVSVLWAGEGVYWNWSNFRSIIELLFLPFRKFYWKCFKERVSGSDFFIEACKRSAIRGDKVFLLGGLSGVAEKSKVILCDKIKDLNIVGTYEGSPCSDYDNEIVALINKSASNILFVAYGCPNQEKWIYRNLKRCKSVKMAIGIGGSFDFVSGNLKRAPRVFIYCGLEWLWRLIIQPSRMNRIFNAVIKFPICFLKRR